MSEEREMSQQTQNRIHYYDASSLDRPTNFPQSGKKIALVIIVAAAIIGVAIFSWYNYTFLQASTRARALVEETLAQQVTYQFPSLAGYCTYSANEIMADLDAKEVSYFVVSTGDSTNSSVTIYHNPPTLTVDEAKALYEKGINSLEPAEAAKLLYGGWELTMSQEAGKGVRLRYADFTSGDVESAIAKALGDQTLSALEALESGTDSSGNTYQSGSIDIDNDAYTWRVSALKLSSVYSVNISDNAMYVGVKLS